MTMSSLNLAYIFLGFLSGFALARTYVLSQRVKKLEEVVNKYFDWNIHD